MRSPVGDERGAACCWGRVVLGRSVLRPYTTRPQQNGPNLLEEIPIHLLCLQRANGPAAHFTFGPLMKGRDMQERKNVVLLFSKLPEVGLVKTRLSILKDGMFPPETAAELYECMLLDVVEIIGQALVDLSEEAAAKQAESGVLDTYELVISTTPAENADPMRDMFAFDEWPMVPTVIVDEGASFDEHYNHSFTQCWDRGADCILSMGADMPALTKADVKFGFQQLHRLFGFERGGIVLAPDQEMGVSVVGWTRDTRFDHSGVYYNADGLTVLPAYIEKAKALGLPTLWLPPIPDIDTMLDFMHNVTLVHALDYCSTFDDICPARRTAAKFIDLGFTTIRVAPNELRDPREHIDK